MTDLDCKQTEKLIPQFLKDELDNRTENLHILSSLQHGLYATEAMAILAATMILTMVVL